MGIYLNKEGAISLNWEGESGLLSILENHDFRIFQAPPDNIIQREPECCIGIFCLEKYQSECVPIKIVEEMTVACTYGMPVFVTLDSNNKKLIEEIEELHQDAFIFDPDLLRYILKVEKVSDSIKEMQDLLNKAKEKDQRFDTRSVKRKWLHKHVKEASADKTTIDFTKKARNGFKKRWGAN